MLQLRREESVVVEAWRVPQSSRLQSAGPHGRITCFLSSITGTGLCPCVTMGALHDARLQSCGSPGTAKHYQATLIAFFSSSAHHGPPKMPDAYTREDALDFMYAPSRGVRNHGQPVMPATVNVRLAALSSFYQFAASYTFTQDGRIQPLFDRASPTAGLHSSKVARVYRALSLEELERFFAAIPTDTIQGKRDRAIFLMYLWTARRRTEIADLYWGDLEQAVIMEQGQRRTSWLYHFRGKGRKLVDDIAELPRLAKEALDSYLEASGRMASMRADSPLFVAVGKRNKRNTPLHSNVIGHLFKGYVRKAGLDTKRITLQSLRHTAAKFRYAAGEGILSIKYLLRHSSLETTYIYLQGLTGSEDPGAKLLEEQFKRFNL